MEFREGAFDFQTSQQNRITLFFIVYYFFTDDDIFLILAILFLVSSNFSDNLIEVLTEPEIRSMTDEEQ